VTALRCDAHLYRAGGPDAGAVLDELAQRLTRAEEVCAAGECSSETRVNYLGMPDEVGPRRVQPRPPTSCQPTTRARCGAATSPPKPHASAPHACLQDRADARQPLTIPQLHDLPAHARLPHRALRTCLRGRARVRCRRWAWRSKPSRAGWRAPARSCCRGDGSRSPPGRGRPRASPAARPRRPRGPRIALLRQKCSPQAMSRRSRVSQRARAQHPGPRCPVDARNQWQPATPRAGAPATCWTLTGARPL